MKLHYGDMTDTSCLIKIISEIQPDEIYNLAAQSHVKVKLKELNKFLKSIFSSSPPYLEFELFIKIV